MTCLRSNHKFPLITSLWKLGTEQFCCLILSNHCDIRWDPEHSECYGHRLIVTLNEWIHGKPTRTFMMTMHVNIISSNILNLPLISRRLQTQLLLPPISCFSRVRLCATPETAAHQAPLSLGFSRQEHWSGLPFPSPVHESKKGKWSRSFVSNS